MTSKLVVNTIEADTGISSVSFGSSISLSSTSKFFFGAAGIDIGADTNINRPASGVLGFNINSSEKLRIESGGGLKFTGQGTSIPVGGILHHTNNNLYVRGGTNGCIVSNQDNTTTVQIYNGYIKFETNDGTEKARIDSSGRLLLGTTTEGYSSADDLTVSTSGATGITIRSGTSNTGTLAFSDGTSGADEYRGYVQYEHQNNALAFGSNGTERFRINSSGLVNIGAGSSASGLSPLLHLHKNASSSTAYLHITNNSTGITNNDGFLLGINGVGDCLVFNKDSTPIRFATAGIERFRIASDGKFYFGNQTVLDPAFNNSVGLSGSGVLGFLSVSRNSDVPLVVGRTGTDGNLIRFFHAGVRDGVLNTDSGGIGLYGNNSLVLGTGNATERLRFNSAGGVSISNTDSNAVHSMSNYDHGNLTYNHRNSRVLTSNGTGWDGNESSDGADPILILGVTDRAGNSDIGDAYGLCLHSDSQDDNDYGPLIGWSNRSNSGNYNTTYAAIVGQKTGQAADHNWSSGALHFFTNKPGGGGYMNNVADMSIDQAGHVMMPRNSRFFAISNSGSSDSNDGATGLISNQFETELVDSNADFDPSNGRFTAPVDGKYEFHFAALHRTLNSGGGSGELTFYKNGNNLSQRSFGYSNIGSGGSSSDHQHLTIHGIFALSAGDYIDVRIHSITSGQDFYFHQGLGYFSGKLLG